MEGTMEPTSGGSMSALITASGSPPGEDHQPLHIVCAVGDIAGQSCDCSTAMASSPMSRLGRPVAWESDA